MHSVGVALLSLIFALHNVKSDSVAFIEQEVVAVQSIKLNIKESDRVRNTMIIKSYFAWANHSFNKREIKPISTIFLTTHRGTTDFSKGSTTIKLKRYVKLVIFFNIVSSISYVNELTYTNSQAAKQDVTCIKEGNMDFSAVTMADTDKFKEETLAECVNFCLKNEPSMSHVLINYYDSLIFSDTFNCICSPEYAFKNSKVLSESQCDTLCPKSHYK